MADDGPGDLPGPANDVASDHPDVWDAYSDLGEACAHAGALDDDTERLVKLALAVGARSEGATHSYARRALDEGIAPGALEHVALLAVTHARLPESHGREDRGRGRHRDRAIATERIESTSTT